MKRRAFVVHCSTAATVLFANTASADETPAFPHGAVTLVVPNAPGGAIDILARLLEQPLHDLWGQPVHIVYKPGAGTVLGTDFVAKTRPADGHILGLVVTSHVINPSLRKNLPFDTVKDLSGVSLLATSSVLLSATPALQVSNLSELIELARSKPGRLTYASPGTGSSMHLAGEMLKQLAHIDMLHVPFNGSSPAYTELFGGRVDLLIDPLFSSLPHVTSGRLKPLAVISPQRSPALPDVPAAVETLSGFVVQSFYGMVVSAATPGHVVRKINADVLAALQSPQVKARMADIGLTVVGSNPREFDSFVRLEIDRWAPIVTSSGARVD